MPNGKGQMAGYWARAFRKPERARQKVARRWQNSESSGSHLSEKNASPKGSGMTAAEQEIDRLKKIKAKEKTTISDSPHLIAFFRKSRKSVILKSEFFLE